MPHIAGTYQRQDRQEWAASRLAEGWSEKIVRDATSAGALEAVRAHMLNGAATDPDPAPARLRCRLNR